MEISRSHSARDAARVAGDALSRELVTKADKPALFLISGGSSLSVLDFMGDISARSNIQIAQVDERFSKDDKELNSVAFRKTLFSRRITERGVPFISFDVRSGGMADECALRYEIYLKRWREAFQEGIIFALLGVGSDGHIAGVLPFAEEKELFDQTFLNTRRWAVGYETGGKGGFPERVTTTLHFLLQEVDFSFVYICGQEKRDALNRTLSPDGTHAETPARVLNEMRNVKIFTDIVQ